MLAHKRFPLLVLLAALAAAIVAVAGCGGGSSDDGGGGGDPATLAPKAAPVYLEATLAPDADEGEAINGLAQSLAGVDDLGGLITEELEREADEEGEKLDFASEVEPWLGDQAGMYLVDYDGEDFQGFGIAIETTNSEEAEAFIEKRIEEDDDDESEEGEFEGHKYYVDEEDESAIGLIGDFLAVGETKANFEEMVKTSEGENLSESSKFTDAEGSASSGFGSVYVDIGALIDEAKGEIPAETEAFFDVLQIDPQDATAIATVIPQTEAVEFDISTDIGKAVTPSGDPSALLESLPATAVLGFASPEFGKSFEEGIDALDEKGIPGEVKPGELKPALESSGIDIDSIVGSIGNVGGFVEGSSPSSVGGAAVFETENASEAENTVSNIGLLLRSARAPGVSPLGNGETGFSVRSAELGPQPLVVSAVGQKIVIAYGVKAAAQAVRSNAKTLGTTPDYEAAKAALGSTPMSLFVDGGPMLKLVKALLSPEEAAQFSEAEPIVQKISYVAVGSEAKGSGGTSKVIVGVSK